MVSTLLSFSYNLSTGAGYLYQAASKQENPSGSQIFFRVEELRVKSAFELSDELVMPEQSALEPSTNCDNLLAKCVKCRQEVLV